MTSMIHGTGVWIEESFTALVLSCYAFFDGSRFWAVFFFFASVLLFRLFYTLLEKERGRKHQDAKYKHEA